MIDSKKPIKVLLIEDDEDDYIVVKKMFRNIKDVLCELSWEKTSASGLEAMKKMDHDIYIVDYRLDGRTGIELIEEAKHLEYDRPIIVLTGLGDESLGTKALRAGADDYLVKAELTSAILERSIRYALERKDADSKRHALIAEQSARRALERQKAELEKSLEQLKKSERIIKERERHYSSIVSSLAAGVIIQSLDGTVESMNRSAEEILGIRTENLKSILSHHTSHGVIHENGAPFPVTEHPSAIVAKTGKPVSNVVMGIPRADGSYGWILINSNPLFYENEPKPYAIVTSFIDISKRKRLEQQKDQFIGTASHELKTPVTSLKLFAELLYNYAQTVSDKTVKEYAEIVLGQSNRLVSLLNDLLDVTRIDAGRLELKQSHFDVDELIKNTIDEYRHTKKTKHDIVHVANAKRPVYADRDRITQVIVNLISNALKYSPQADKIIIETKEDGNAVRVSVKDFGFGIPEDEVDKIFERFFRAKDSHEKNIPGFGLGLHICQEIIRRHGDEIKIDTKVGEGSVFSFRLKIRN